MATSAWKKIRSTLKLSNLIRYVFDPAYPLFAMVLILVAELFLSIFIVQNVKYTEIDWIAYMQEVEGVKNGTFDYMQLQGDTGPLVYPAGFVYIFMALHYITDLGRNIRLAQYIFVGFFLLNLALVFNIYQKMKMVPPYVFVFMCVFAYRIHSIFMLRMFNDTIAMLFLYAAISLFLVDQWGIGCLLYSIGVSVKMNVLLFAPALLMLLVLRHGWKKSILFYILFICAGVQLVLGAPFLYTNLPGYMIRSFELGRQFKFEWTVNWRFLPEEVFLDRGFQLALLGGHIVTLLFFFITRWIPILEGARMLLVAPKKLSPDNEEVKNNFIVLSLFTSNFIGICFSRSLHYQFYSWYFHTIHYLLWNTKLHAATKLLILGVIEMAWNVFPSTSLSSATLHLCHFVLLFFLWWAMGPLSLSKVKTTAKAEKTH